MSAILAGSPGSLTKTTSGSKTVDAAIAANATKAVNITPGAYVDIVAGYLAPGSNKSYSWVLALQQSSGDPANGRKNPGRNGIYKRDGDNWIFQGFGPEYIGVTGGTSKGVVFKKVEQVENGKIVDVYYVNTVTGQRTDIPSSITPEKTTQISMPSPTVGGGAVFTSPVITGTLPGNTGITGGGVPSKNNSPLTAAGIDINPLYIVGAIVLLAGAWFAHKKGLF